MISQNLIDKAKYVAYKDSDMYGVPSKFQIDFSVEKAFIISKKLDANTKIVTIGMYLADCAIGKAFTENRLKDHIDMALIEAEKLFEDKNDLLIEEKNNIISCIKQHHGAKKFLTLESEICCNADSYKFCSLIGFIDSIRSMSKMDMYSSLRLLQSKIDEKWHQLSFPYCKKELEPQYRLLKNNLKILLKS